MLQHKFRQQESGASSTKDGAPGASKDQPGAQSTPGKRDPDKAAASGARRSVLGSSASSLAGISKSRPSAVNASAAQPPTTPKGGAAGGEEGKAGGKAEGGQAYFVKLLRSKQF